MTVRNGTERSLLHPALLALAALLATLTVFLAAFSDRAEAKVPIKSFHTELSTTQAGGHPDVVLQFEIGNSITEPPVPCECNTLSGVIVNTPAGLVGVPNNIPQCTLSEFATFKCPSDSQIGISVVRLCCELPKGEYWFQPIYNMVPRPDQLALWASVTPLAPFPSVFTGISVRTEGDYGLEFATGGIASAVPPNEITLINWGVPAADIHDSLRWPTNLGPDGVLAQTRLCYSKFGSPLPQLIASQNPPPEQCPVEYPPGPVPTTYPPAPYTISPTTCIGTTVAQIETQAFDLESDFAETVFPAITGCDQLSFDPSLGAKPTTAETDSPSGLDIDLKAPQGISPTAPSPSQIRATEVTLPPGFTINPGAADGKVACTAEQANFGSRDAAECPESAKIGTLSIGSASLPGTLPGAIYLGEPLPGDRFRVLLVADGFSLHLKLPGTVRPDPESGQLRLSFEDLPPLPFEEFDLHVFGSERGLLATPTKCGTYPVETTFAPWDNALAEQSSTQFFTIDSGPRGTPCPTSGRPFSPGMSAGVLDGTAGSHSPFVVEFDRGDGDQNLSGLRVETPPGFVATLKGVPYCPDSAIATLRDPGYAGLSERSASACPAASQIGTVTAGAGAGTHPVYLPGKAYLAGPYKGAPLSLVAVVPAVSGPYDLGNVAVRAAIEVDSATAQVTTSSDPLPQILEGVPLKTRFIRVDLDRRGFALNPTNCDPFAVEGQALGDEGARVGLVAPFQVANCADLRYKPKLDLKLVGGSKRLGHPSIRAKFTARPGESNTRLVSVSLPPGELLDNAHIGAICTRPAFAGDACPAGSKIGTASADTPLLDQPLRGGVYLRSNPQRTLPDLVMDLEGQIDIELVGAIDTTKDDALRTVFSSVPDAPVSSFTLNLVGGAKGLLVNSEDLCAKPRRATVRMAGQNGAVARSKVKLKTTCGKRRARR